MAGVPPSTTTAVSGGVAATTAGARVFLSHVSEASKLALAQRRPWTEMIDKNSFAKPENLNDALARVRKNLGYFRVNYIIALLGIVGLNLIVHPFAFFTLAMILAAWGYLYMIRRDPLVLWGRTFNEKEIVVIMAVLTITGLFLTNVGSLLMSTILFGVTVIAIHGAFRVPDDLFLDDQDTSSGFLSFLGTGHPQPPTVVSYV